MNHSSNTFKTADLYDKHLENLQVALPIFRDFGGKTSFHGQIVTLQAFEDNSLLKASFEQDGKGKVLVVDTGASLRCAMMGDVMASLGANHGWEGIIINGCIRDSAAISSINLGVKALATTPRKTIKQQQGIIGGTLHFAGISFVHNAFTYADEDGIVTLNQVAGEGLG